MIGYCHSTCLVVTRLVSVISLGEVVHLDTHDDFLGLYQLLKLNSTKKLYRLVYCRYQEIDP